MIKGEQIEILSTEIIDHTIDDEYGFVRPSDISVLVEYRFKEKTHYLDFQTTLTQDAGAYSSILEPYRCDSYEEVRGLFEREEDFLELVELVKQKSNADLLRNSYVQELFIIDDSPYGGIDGRSEINSAKRRL